MSDYEEEEAVEGNSDNRMGSSSRGPPPVPIPMPGQGDIERQRDLQEALLLQMDMQKRLHEQLEVSFLHSPSTHMQETRRSHTSVQCNDIILEGSDLLFFAVYCC